MTETSGQVLEKEEVALAQPLKVIVWDDPVNLMSYVVMVFKKVFPEWGIEKCKKKMLEVHNEGKSVVFVGPREEAELVAAKISSFRLWVTIEE